MNNLLLVTIFLPLAGVGLLWALAPTGRSAVRIGALLVTLLTFAASAWLIAGYSAGTADYAATNAPWLGEGAGLDVRFHVGLDGISLWLFGLSALLCVTAVLVSWEAIKDQSTEFYAMLLLLETGMLGVFAARDIILFYVFFEFTLIPLYFLIGIWGSEDRRHAAIKFFLFTLAGSVLTFLGLLAIVLCSPNPDGSLTFSIPELTQNAALGRLAPVDSAVGAGGATLRGVPLQVLIFGALFAGFAIKVPLFPFHTWLPLAHVQAPTAGSVILAGVLLKIGTYGFVRFNMPMLPDATALLMPWLLWLSVAGIIYGALVALAQTDIKRLIAYSSVSHLGFCMLGLFALNRLGTQGGMLQAVNHGLSTGGLFAIVGMIYERYHTRKISDLGGLASRTPLLATMMVLFTFSSIGLPGLNGFAGEILLLTGMFQRGWAGDLPLELASQLKIISVLAVTGVVLGAWYMLYLVQRVFFGPLREPAHEKDEPPVADLCPRELAALAPLVVFVFWIGLQPSFFLDRMSSDLNQVTEKVEMAFERSQDKAQTAKAKSVAEGGWSRVD